MRYFALLIFTVLLAMPVMAQDKSDYEQRLEFAKKVQSYRPVKKQIDNAIEVYLSKIPVSQRAPYEDALKKILNYQALETLSVNSYAEVYTLPELKAMAEYYAKPEAQSAIDKSGDYADKIYPEIIRMIDKALMRAKTGE